ncbi:amino acid/polyamine/organocation transporter (APC superfamily) [Nocardia tenerifensis]|uniref:Amino acid/polyamine/organocation transporter (APC superfamily) n=1 Tax=Nocardia tenerifensis TaxID=228006 RepID=A0A318KA61_9NOCA|nr:APC family permease [Nocardia tenerifensis]PXX71451.1 amino acid/polyamine/organocation transporter (APC superfamily) [Nocardia tenerifensis]
MTSTNEPVVHDHRLRRGSVGVFGVTFFVISAAAPLTAMAGGAPLAMLLGNGPGVPGAYLLTVATLLVFAVGYTAMARHHISTGAFYSYVTRGLRQQFGGAAAYLALVSYNAMQIGLWGLFGAATGGFLADEFGLRIDWWVYVVLGIAAVAVLGYRQIDLSVKVLSILVAAEFLVVLVLAAVIAVRGGDFGTAPVSVTPLLPSALTGGSLPIALLFCFASFIGFEATALYSEEAEDPRRTVPRATFLSVVTIGVAYTFVTFLMINGAGVDTTRGFIERLSDPTTFLFELADSYVGPWFTTIMRMLFCTSVFAAVLAFHNAVARYVYALGREGLLPGHAGRTHLVHRSPHVGSVAQSVLALVVVAVFAATGQDPVRALFTWLTNLGTLGVIALMAACSFAVAAFFLRHRDLDRNIVRTLVAPVVAGLALTAILGYAVANFDLLISAGGVLVWLLPSLLLVAAAAGVVASLILRARAPRRYARMGQHYV